MFIKNIRSNFTKNSVEYNNRYMVYNKKDINWDYADDFYEKHGTKTDKFKYFLAKQARALNIDGPLARVLAPTVFWDHSTMPLNILMHVNALEAMQFVNALQAAERRDISQLLKFTNKLTICTTIVCLMKKVTLILIKTSLLPQTSRRRSNLTSPLQGMSEQLDRWFQQT